MRNLFSMFDPSIYILSFSWFSVLAIFFYLPLLYWNFNYFFLLFFIVINSVKVELDYVIFNCKKGRYSFIGSIFLSVVLLNICAIFPFIFSSTSHLLVTLPLSYCFWFCVITFIFFKSFTDFLTHLVPLGTPLVLLSFIVVVELISNIIRPVALMFRLTANLMAGHLLMSLIGGFLIRLGVLGVFLGSFFQLLLVFMEICVSVIQSYVFSTLLTLYLSEGEH